MGFPRPQGIAMASDICFAQLSAYVPKKIQVDDFFPDFLKALITPSL